MRGKLRGLGGCADGMDDKGGIGLQDRKKGVFNVRLTALIAVTSVGRTRRQPSARPLSVRPFRPPFAPPLALRFRPFQHVPATSVQSAKTSPTQTTSTKGITSLRLRDLSLLIALAPLHSDLRLPASLRPRLTMLPYVGQPACLPNASTNCQDGSGATRTPPAVEVVGYSCNPQDDVFEDPVAFLFPSQASPPFLETLLLALNIPGMYYVLRKKNDIQHCSSNFQLSRIETTTDYHLLEREIRESQPERGAGKTRSFLRSAN
ncbi:hypothetical protein NMY22_g16345 [Coprinellus aureogranulatus]|nr:hypothetical protein NMY22_g16345 [Coprinellus aureogranulatus]